MHLKDTNYCHLCVCNSDCMLQRAADQQVSYLPWDFNYHAKQQQGAHFLADIAPVINRCLSGTGLFALKQSPAPLQVRLGRKRKRL